MSGRSPELKAFAVGAVAGLVAVTILAAANAAPEVVLDPSLGFARPANAPELPKGEGRSLVERRCTVCHALDLVLQQRLSPEAWQNEVKKMRGWGAYLEDDEAAAVVQVLASSLGRGDPRYVPALLDPREAPARTRAETPGTTRGDAVRGADLYKGNCASCHGEQAEGARGPALRGRPIATQPHKFAAVVQTGSGDMPGYPVLQQEAVEDLFAFVAARSP